MLAMQSYRAPSWKAIAHCILKNDLQLLGLGFEPVNSKWAEVLAVQMTKKESNQMELFL